jgi:hypothetical protein
LVALALSPDRLGEEAVRTRLHDSRPDNVTDFTGLCINNYRLKPGRASYKLSSVAPGLLQKQIGGLAHAHSRPKSRVCSLIRACRRASRSDLTASSTCPSMPAPGVPGRIEYLNEKAAA